MLAAVLMHDGVESVHPEAAETLHAAAFRLLKWSHQACLFLPTSEQRVISLFLSCSCHETCVENVAWCPFMSHWDDWVKLVMSTHEESGFGDSMGAPLLIQHKLSHRTKELICSIYLYPENNMFLLVPLDNEWMVCWFGTQVQSGVCYPKHPSVPCQHEFYGKQVWVFTSMYHYYYYDTIWLLLLYEGNCWNLWMWQQNPTELHRNTRAQTIIQVVNNSGRSSTQI